MRIHVHMTAPRLKVKASKPRRPVGPGITGAYSRAAAKTMPRRVTPFGGVK